MKKQKENKDEKISAPTHKRKKEGKKKQVSKQQVREKLAKLQNEVIASQEEQKSKKDTRKQHENRTENNKNKSKNNQKSPKKPYSKSNQSKKAKNNVSFTPHIVKDVNAKVKIIPLGGLNEIGKNITAIECGDDIIVIDCGFGFPDEEMLGIDLVIPDFTYLKDNIDKVRAVLLTH